jgi:uncharacterized protein with von Willebrand factor type A (vWA) domain
MNEESRDVTTGEETNGIVEKSLEDEGIRKVLASPRTIPRKVREGIARILAQEIVLGEPYDIKDVRRFMKRFGAFYPIFLGLKNSEVWRRLTSISVQNRNASAYALQSVLVKILDILEEFWKHSAELQKALDKNMAGILEELRELIEDTLRLWGRRVPGEVPRPPKHPLDIAELFKDIIHLSERAREAGLRKEDMEELVEVLREGGQTHEEFVSSLEEIWGGLKDDNRFDEERTKALEETLKKAESQMKRDGKKLREKTENLAEDLDEGNGETLTKDTLDLEKLMTDMIGPLEKLANDASEVFEKQTYRSVAGLPDRVDRFCESQEGQELLDLVIQRMMVPHLTGLIDEMTEHLELLDMLSALFPGRSWDYLLGELSQTYLGNVKKYADILRRSEDLKKILDMIGRIELEYGSRRLAISPFGTSEVYSIRTSNDISHLLPAELAKLSKESLRTLFYAKWIEGKLLTYQFRGRSWVGGPPKKKRRGPVVALVDTSGSMSGSPEIVAKAVILAVAKRMLKEKRDVKVILFSSTGQTSEIELTSMRKMAVEFLDFLSYSFGGGTDFNTALESGMKSLKEKKFTSADLLFITDGLSVVSDKSLISKWNKLKKEEDARIFTLTVGNDTAGGLEDLSDHTFLLADYEEWDPDEGPACMIRLIASKPGATRVLGE